jgi:hypothetical protein
MLSRVLLLPELDCISGCICVGGVLSAEYAIGIDALNEEVNRSKSKNMAVFVFLLMQMCLNDYRKPYCNVTAYIYYRSFVPEERPEPSFIKKNE